MDSEKNDDYMNKLTTYLFYLFAFLFFIAFNFQDSKTSGWYQQFLPAGLPNFQVSDVFFLDSIRGWVVSGNTTPNDSSGFILKTTNSGDNWVVLHGEVRDFTRVKFLNANTGFVCGGYSTGAVLYKSTDGGLNWFPLNIPGGGQIIFDDMAVLNQDTIWLVARESLVGGAFRTTNGGVSWEQKFAGGSENPNEIYFYNANLGFISGNPSPRKIRRTTDGGNSWTVVHYNDYFQDMYFYDSLLGWKCSAFGMKKTTDGGLNWITQQIPDGGNIIISGIQYFSNINKDTIWGTGGSILLPSNPIRGILYRTINQGANWYYQIPDTSIHISQYWFMNFVNKLNGWATQTNGTEIHTTVGGDTTFLSAIKQINKVIPNEYKLYQNYPNPFNQISKIKYEISKMNRVKINVFDISGRLVQTIFDGKQSPGTYEVTFDAGNLSSGVYFYSLFVNGIRIDTKKAVLIK